MTFKYIRCYETNEYWSIEDYEKDFERLNDTPKTVHRSTEIS